MATMTSITNFNRKTLKQHKNQSIKATKAIEFAKKAGMPAFESFAGGYEEFGDVIGVKAGYFNQYAFIQSDSNLSSAGTGLQANNRQEVNAQ
jgi:hypothetical protein